MPNIARFAFLLLGAMLATVDAAPAQDIPSLDVLRAIAAKLPHRPHTLGTTFQRSGSAAADPGARCCTSR
ncbi:MAG: hypothetical protein ACLQF4_15810 [Xanthobacteraceae bacterium]